MKNGPEQAVCDACLRACVLGEGETGFCSIRGNQDGTILPVVSFVITEAAADRIEKKPVFHFWPGSRVYSLGAWGCSFHCTYCRNHDVACIREVPEGRPLPSPRDLIQQARDLKCDGIAWTFSEPTLWYETLSHYAERSASDGLYTLMLTNGAASQSVYARLVSSGVNVWKVDLKGFSDRAYRRLAGFSGWTRILDNLNWLRRCGGHLELSYCPIPGLCDGEDEVLALGRWVAAELGPDTPLHLLAFFPAFRMRDLPFSEAVALSRLRALLQEEAGLHHVYIPLSFDPEEVATYCAACRSVLIERSALGPPRLYLSGSGQCNTCGALSPLVMPESFERQRYGS